MLKYGYHKQALFRQYHQNGTLLSCEICQGLWEKYELSCDTKISKSWNSWKNPTGLPLSMKVIIVEKLGSSFWKMLPDCDKIFKVFDELVSFCYPYVL